MKKIIVTLLLAAVTLGSMISCNNEAKNPDDSTNQSTTTTSTVTTTTTTTSKATTTTTTDNTDPVPSEPVDDRAPLAYSIDVDITIESANAGFVFCAYDADNFMMWQLAIGEHNDGLLYCRPHTWTNASPACAYEPVVNDVIPDIPVEYGTTYHLTLQILEDESLVTLINDVEIDYDTGFKGNIKLEEGIGMIGFRCTSTQTEPEIGIYDNIVIKNGAGDVLLNETFDDAGTMFCASIIDEYPGQVEVVDGALRVVGGGNGIGTGVLYMTPLN